MKIIKAEYMKGATAPEHYPEANVPEIIITGRSNVGKSSFINSITGRKALAKTSSRPGKTQVLNFFNIDDAWRIVDVPGYGYAKIPQHVRDAFGVMIERYMVERETLIAGVLLVDFRHGPTEDDLAMHNVYNYYEIPVLVVCTKKDKVRRSQHAKHENMIREALDMDQDDVLIVHSSETHEGRDDVLFVINDLIEQWKALD